jgi:outer membrane protein TolC
MVARVQYSLIVFVSLAFAQESIQTFSMKAAIQYALTHSPSLQNTYLDYQIARQKIAEVRSAGLPQINSTTTFRYFVEIPTSLVPGEFFGAPRGTFIPIRFGVPYNLEIGVTGTQLLFDGTYFVGLSAARAVKELTYRSYQRSRIETITAVSKAYLTVLITQERLRLLKENLDQLQTTLRQTQGLYEAGFAEKLDYQRLEVAYNNLQTEYNKAAELTALAYLTLKLQMGYPLDQPIALTDTLPELPLLLPDSLSLQNFDPAQRLEYQILLAQRRALELNLRRYQVAYLPSLVFISSLATQAQRNEFDFFDTKKRWFPIAFIGFQLQVPLFDGLRKASQVSQARLELLKNQNDLYQLRQALTLEAQNARIQLLNALQNLAIQKRNLELAQTVLETTQKKVEAGLASTVESVQAQNAYQQAQLGYTTALLEAYSAYIDWQKALGLLSEPE